MCPYPPSSRSFILIVDPSFYLVFPLIFFPVFFIFYVWPRPMRRPEWCLFPQNFSGTVATYRRVCQVWNLGPVPEKNSFFPAYLLLSSRPRVYWSLGKSLERLFSLLDSNPVNSLHFPDPRFLFSWTTQFHFSASKILERTCRFSIFPFVGSH
jgi:hypothetical protein